MELSVKYKQKTGINNYLILQSQSMLKSDSQQHLQFTKVQGTKALYKNRAPWNSNEIKAYRSCINEILREGKSGLKLMRQDFKQMSHRVKSRNANQCRIFHLKMSKVIENVEEINNFFISQDNMLFNGQHAWTKQAILLGKKKQSMNLQTVNNPAICEVQNGALFEKKSEFLEMAFMSGIRLYDQYVWIDQIQEFVTCLANKKWLEEME